MELACEPPALELLSGDHTAERVARDSEREVDGDGRARGELLGESKVGVGESRVSAKPVVGDDDADRPIACIEWHVEPCRGRHELHRLLVHLWIFHGRVDALAVSALEHAAGLRLPARNLDSDELAGVLAVGCRDPQLAAGREHDRHQLRTDQLAEAARDEIEQGRQFELADERVADLVQRLELARPGRRRLVEPGVLDRDGGLGSQQRYQLLVILGEVLAALLLGQVEVSVGDVAQQDRHSQERPHLGVVRWEADRPRIGRADRCRRSGRASSMSTPRMPRPRGRSPIASASRCSMPVKTKRSRPVPLGSITPSAA